MESQEEIKVEIKPDILEVIVHEDIKPNILEIIHEEDEVIERDENEGFSFEMQPEVKVRKAILQHNSNGNLEHEEITDDGENVVITVQIEDALNHPELSDVLEDNGEEDNDDGGETDENADLGEESNRSKRRLKSSFICHHCGYKAQSNPALKNHVIAVHEKLKPYLCDICGYSASAKTNLEMHKAIKHLGKKSSVFSCEECSYKCNNDTHLKAHIQIVHVEKLTPFECGVCQYQCRKRCLVIKHMKIVHEKNKPYTCELCQRAFSANCILQRHVEMVHKKLRPYACQDCGYAFAERRFLTKHVRAVHEKSKPYTCKKCDYRCAMKDSLVRHNYNKHERKARFICRICPTTFRKRIEMEEHYKEAHSVMFRAYACESCTYSTDKKPRLEKHILMEHTKGDHNRYRNLKCSECSETFLQHTQLSEHSLKAHGIELQSYVCDSSGIQPRRGKKRGRPAKTTMKIDEESGGECKPEYVEANEVEVDYRKSSSRRIKRPKTLEDYYTPFVNGIEYNDKDNNDFVEEISNDGDATDDLDEEIMTVERNHNIQQSITEDGDESFQSQLQEETFAEECITYGEYELNEPGQIDRSTKESPNQRTIRFTVRTKGYTDDKPIELEIELKDPQGQPVEEASEENLQRDAQTIVNCLADGTFIDAIMSVDRKASAAEVPPDEDMAIKTIDVSQSPQPTEGARKGKRTPGSRRTFLCDICGFGCTSRQTLNTHYAYKHGSLRPDSLLCDLCDYRCDLSTQLNLHKQIVHTEGVVPFACSLCPQQYKTEGDLDRHLRAIHLDERPFVCPTCKHGFSKKSNLLKHVKMVHDRVRPFQCQLCEWSFGEKRDLQSHVDAVHNKIKPFQCSQCDFKCARSTQLRVHLGNVHRVKPTYDCEICGHRFVNKSYLNSHIKSVHEVEIKRFQCGYCEFTSVTKLSIDRHMTTHTKEKRAGALAPLFCSYCGSTFPNHAKLAKHVRQEHGATAAVPKKVYDCSSCQYKAGTHSLLKAHVRSVHENERRFKCELCDFTSYAKSAMKRHISAIHEKYKPFNCDLCEFKTSYKESLDLHMASVHKSGDLPKRVVSRKLKKEKFEEPLSINPDQNSIFLSDICVDL